MSVSTQRSVQRTRNKSLKQKQRPQIRTNRKANEVQRRIGKEDIKRETNELVFFFFALAQILLMQSIDKFKFVVTKQDKQAKLNNFLLKRRRQEKNTA